jgi:hypothetical protein
MGEPALTLSLELLHGQLCLVANPGYWAVGDHFIALFLVFETISVWITLSCFVSGGSMTMDCPTMSIFPGEARDTFL